MKKWIACLLAALLMAAGCAYADPDGAAGSGTSVPEGSFDRPFALDVSYVFTAEINEDGTMQQPVLKSWQASVERAIDQQMSAAGELSVVDGKGCSFYIDPSQNVLSTSQVVGVLKVRPFGYARDIIVNIGLLTQNS